MSASKKIVRKTVHYAVPAHDEGPSIKAIVKWAKARWPRLKFRLGLRTTDGITWYQFRFPIPGGHFHTLDVRKGETLIGVTTALETSLEDFEIKPIGYEA
ncbi:hypothetical protein PLCT2_00842 [Planctomycetaceae bacterium]|nr:hypothetical protein PLCT2_00842 [Planctomycetaceae bacterium]